MPAHQPSEPTDNGLPAQQQQPPGLTAPMHPQPDHGEATYRGHERLTGKKAFITGGDSGIGRPSRSPSPERAPTSPSLTFPKSRKMPT